MTMTLFWQIVNLTILAFCIIALYFLANGAPYLPTSQSAIDEMIKVSNIQPGQRVIDIGSGDGRILIAFAKAGALTEGYEVNPLLVWWSRRKIQRAGVADRCTVHLKSFWSADFSHADVLTVFGIRNIMGRLEKKCRGSMKPGSLVLSHIFLFPNWQPTASNDTKGVHLYTV